MKPRPGGRVSVKCPAKINLFLRIVAREDSGYHQIETLFQAIDLFDRVDVYPALQGIELEVRGGEASSELGDLTAELGQPANNTVVHAARAFFGATGITPAASLVLTKAIPAGTGLGGGSSDAAGALAALNVLHGTPLRHGDLIELGGAIGADVPFFCAGMPTALAWGRGDRLWGSPPPPAAPVVLVIPRTRISTAAAYRELSGRLELPTPPARLEGLASGDWRRFAELQWNDFESVAFEWAPELAEVRGALDDAGAVLARMTGSGSAVFGVFDAGEEDRARMAAEAAGSMAGVRAALVVLTLTRMPRAERVHP